MSDRAPTPQINVSKIEGGSGVALIVHFNDTKPQVSVGCQPLRKIVRQHSNCRYHPLPPRTTQEYTNGRATFALFPSGVRSCACSCFFVSVL